MNAMDATHLLANEIFSIWSDSPNPVEIRLEGLDSVGFNTIDKAIQYINQYHLQMLEKAKSFILKLVEKGAGGSAEMTPFEIKVSKNNGKVSVNIQLGTLKLSEF